LGKAWPALDIYVPGCDPLTPGPPPRQPRWGGLQELVLAELDDFQPSAIEESDDSRLRAFFSSEASRDAAARALAGAFGRHLCVESVQVADEDWAARSQADLRAVTVGNLVIAPPWDVPEKGVRPHFLPEADESSKKWGLTPYTIIIRPSMGFGTGHHATTRLLLQALQAIAVQDRTVLDIGCGSGVLAVAAARLGAYSTLGIDIDADALANAAENLELNALGDRVSFQNKDFREISSTFGVVCANLTGALLESSASKLAALVERGGYLIVSGFMDSETSVVPALEKFLGLQKIEQEEEWMCALLIT
jgi:ribosomal protein L11 methyltransferase